MCEQAPVKAQSARSVFSTASVPSISAASVRGDVHRHHHRDRRFGITTSGEHVERVQERRQVPVLEQLLHGASPLVARWPEIPVTTW